MFCKFCGKQLVDGAKFCSKCGKQLSIEEDKKSELSSENTELKPDSSDPKFCKFCGKQLLKTATFCSKCGKQLCEKDSLSSSEINTTKTELPNEILSESLKTPEKESLPNEKTVFEDSELEIKKKSTVSESTFEKTDSPKTEEQNLKIPIPVYSYSTKEEKFGIKNLFSHVFKKHTPQERDEILKAGLYGDANLSQIKISSDQFHPWLYSRVFLILFAVFVICEICLLSFWNSNILPGVMFMGSVMLPFSILTLYFELNIYKDISFYKVIGIFLLGGTLSLVSTLFFYEIIPTYDDYSFLSASLISIIEEFGKGIIVILILKRTKNITVLHGILIGGAIGCGFAVFESAGYAFNSYLDAHDYNTRAEIVNTYISKYSQYAYTDSWEEMNLNIIMRSILSFGGHTAWAAITGAGFAKEKRINLGFIKIFAICFILHALWDTDTPAWYLKLGALCIAAWWVIIKQISNFIESKKEAENV